MDDSAIEMTPAIGSDGEPVYCATDDPETSPAPPPLPPRAPLLEVILVLGAGLVLLALSARLK